MPRWRANMSRKILSPAGLSQSSGNKIRATNRAPRILQERYDHLAAAEVLPHLIRPDAHKKPLAFNVHGNFQIALRDGGQRRRIEHVRPVERRFRIDVSVELARAGCEHGKVRKPGARKVYCRHSQYKTIAATDCCFVK